MDERLVAALPWLLEIAKKDEFPESVFAAESIIDVLYQIAEANGDSDPETSQPVLEKLTELGVNYEHILRLHTKPLRDQLNTRLENADKSLQDLWFALCMITAPGLAARNEEVICAEWSFWIDHNPADMVEFPAERFALMPSIPYPILNLLLTHYGPGAFNLDKLFEEVEYQLKVTFARYRDLFVIQKLTTTPN